ncbi:peroxisomal biogenesis factor 11 (PEX11) domain-containing protein [Phthorimaea operculella]|nr:peroxisomal biogenesis factor 11 (PEX11) domain-containing protein [Phthorimaea operculella]
MDIVIKVNNQSNGRDKLARLVQYTSRLIWHQLESRHANKYSVDRIKNLELTLSSFRKILRLGRCVDVGYTALNTMQIEDPILRFCLTASKLSNALFLYADHIVWLTKSGFLKTDSEKWNKTANKFWLLSIVANLARDLYELCHIIKLHNPTFLKPSELLNGPAKTINYAETAKYVFMLMNCHKDVFIDTLKNSCDLFIPLTALGFTKFSPSTVGMLGAVSSLAALVTIVQPISKLVPA